MNKGKSKIKFRLRILLMILVPVFAICLFLGVVAVFEVSKVGNRGMRDELASFCSATLERYNTYNDDKYTYNNGVLMKGNVKISGDYAAIDALKEDTQLETTIFC